MQLRLDLHGGEHSPIFLQSKSDVERLEAAMSMQGLGVVIGLAMLLGTSGCAQRPTILADSADGVRVRWYRWDADLLDATRIADDRCAARGRRADLRQVSANRDIELADFACR